MKKKTTGLLITAMISVFILVLLLLFVLGQREQNEPNNVPIDTEVLELDAEERMSWAGKRCLMLGDSITYLDGKADFNDDSIVLEGYPTHLMQLGFESIENLAVSASTIAYREESLVFDVPEVASMVDFSNYDVIIIAAGVNDYRKSTTIGIYKEGERDNTTLVGSLQIMIELIQSQNPEAQIILWTPLPCRGSDKENNLGLTLANYANAISGVGKVYDLPVLYLTDYELFAEYIDDYTMDGLHPNNMGYKNVCDKKVIPFMLDMKAVIEETEETEP